MDEHIKTEISWMPDGKGGVHPTPDLLTLTEAIRYLRIDQQNIKFPDQTLLRYRKLFGLKAVQIGRSVLFPRKEIERFVIQQIEQNPR